MNRGKSVRVYFDPINFSNVSIRNAIQISRQLSTRVLTFMSAKF